MTLYFFAWTASILFALEAVASKLVSKHSVPNYWFFNFFLFFFIFIFTVPIALWFGVSLPLQWMYILLGSVSFALATVFSTISIYKLDVSILSPLFNVRTAFAIIIGSLFLNEVLNPHQYLLIAIIFLFGIFVSLDEHFEIKSVFNLNILAALFCMFFLAISAAFFKKSVMVNGYWNTAFWTPFIGQCWLLFTIPFFKNELKKVKISQYWFIILVALFGVFGTLTANAAYAKNVSIAAVIISIPLSMIIAFLFSIFTPELLEKHTNKVYLIRFISAAIMIIAALNL
jgi:drug/metabolite transporter (DMT)-like permease